MNREVELHDSTLAGIEAVGRDVVIRLAPAYVHHSEGRPGIDPGSGCHQDIDLVIREAVTESSPSRLPCWLSDGALSIGEATWENAIPLPLAASGAVSFSAVTAEGESLVVRGTSAEALPRGEARYVEPFPAAADA